MADEIGYPVMLKAPWGGGGRGMRVIRERADLAREVAEARREAKAAFGKDEVYLEKLVERARHVESQILGDTHGNAAQLFERDCSIQRRSQKVIERAGTPLSRISIRPRPSLVWSRPTSRPAKQHGAVAQATERSSIVAMAP